MRVKVQDVLMDAGPGYLDIGDVVFVIHSFAVEGHETLDGEDIAIGKLFSQASVGYPLSLLLQQLAEDRKKQELLEIVNEDES